MNINMDVNCDIEEAVAAEPVRIAIALPSTPEKDRLIQALVAFGAEHETTYEIGVTIGHLVNNMGHSQEGAAKLVCKIYLLGADP